MKSYQVRRHIAAKPAAVWATLTDADRLTAAGTGIERIDGRIEPASTFTLWSKAVPGRGFKTRVSEMTPPHRMMWEGGMPAGLFRGVRTFTLTAADGGTDFVMREEFTGLMLPLLWRSMPDLQPSFDAFAEGLARTTEAAR
ncbi:MAG: SRPBCC domain-containing protein [Dermatophilaceae bacterium]